MADYKPLVLHQDNPYKERMERRVTTSTASDNGMILNEEVTITRKRQYVNGPGWVKLTQDTEKLKGLSPWGWQIIGYMALTLKPNQEQIKLNCKDIGMDRRKYDKTILQLLLLDIIAKTGKREWYWINVGIILFGTINKH